MANEKLNCLRVKTPAGWETPGEIYEKNSNGTWTRAEDFYFKVGGEWRQCTDVGCGNTIDTFNSIEGIPLAQHEGESGYSWTDASDRDLYINSSPYGNIASPNMVKASGCSRSVSVDSRYTAAVSDYKITSSNVDLSFRMVNIDEKESGMMLYWDGLEKSNGIFVSCYSAPGNNNAHYYYVTITQYLFGNIVAQLTCYPAPGYPYGDPYSYYDFYVDRVDVVVSIEDLGIYANIIFRNQDGTYHYPREITSHLQPYKQNVGLGIISHGYSGMDNLIISC